MKNIRLIFLLSISILLLSSCGGSDEKIVITILGENASSLQAMQALESEYEKQNPAIDLRFKPNSFDDAFTKSNQDFANGTGLYDIILQYNFSLASFVENNYVYKLGEMFELTKTDKSSLSFEKDIFEEAWKEVGYYEDKNTGEIQKIGYPFATNTNVLVYNKSLFNNPEYRSEYKEKYGKELEVPKTWQDFYNIASFFTRPDQNLHGVCLQGADVWVYGEFVNFLYSMGGKVMDKKYGWQGDENTPILLDSKEALDALNFYLSLKDFNSGTFSNIDMFEQSKILKEGNTAMGLTWSDAIYPSFSEENGFNPNFGFAPIPGDVSILTGGTYFVNRKTKNIDAVVDYIVDLMQYENQVKLAEKGLCSPLKSVYDDERVKKLPYSEAVKNSLERGIYMMEAGIETNIVSEVMSIYIQKAWIGELTAEQALSKMQKEIEERRSQLYSQLN